MRGIVTAIGERYHPLFHLRKYSIYRHASRWLDVPFGIRIPPIRHTVFVSFSKNLSLILSGGQYGESAERKHFSTLVACGNFYRFLDIGANVGIYGFIFKTLVEPGTVTLIEPDFRNVKLLRKTIAAGALEHVKVIEAAVSDSPGEASFFRDDLTGATGSIEHKESSSFVFRHHQQVPQHVMVNCITLDDLFSSQEDDPDLMKIDAEGAEASIFRGGRKLLERSRPALIFECDKHQPSVTSMLSRLGYVLFDFRTMRKADTVVHNTLALHLDHHNDVLEIISP